MSSGFERVISKTLVRRVIARPRNATQSRSVCARTGRWIGPVAAGGGAVEVGRHVDGGQEEDEVCAE